MGIKDKKYWWQIFNTLTEEQKEAMQLLVGALMGIDWQRFSDNLDEYFYEQKSILEILDTLTEEQKIAMHIVASHCVMGAIKGESYEGENDE